MDNENGMIGAIVGDIVGSRFEWDNRKTKDFELFVTRDDYVWKVSKGYTEAKSAYEAENKEESSRRWWQWWKRRKRLGSILSESGSLLSSSIKVDADAPRHPFCNTDQACYYTDDTVMTLAVADALIKCKDNGGDLGAVAIMCMQEFGRSFPNAGYGGHFHQWLHDDNPQPYNSWGNGAAMRVSACGWAGRTLDEVKAMSRAVTKVSHDHREGIKGAEATAVATFLARTGKTMEEIKAVVVSDYYPLGFTLDEIRPTYAFDVSCQGSVPQALEAFFESKSFEDAIRNAISIGGDSDTIGAICGAVAGAYYGVPDDIRAQAESFLDPFLLETLKRFEVVFSRS